MKHLQNWEKYNEAFSIVLTGLSIYFFMKFLKGLIVSHPNIILKPTERYYIWATIKQIKLDGKIEATKIDDSSYQFSIDNEILIIDLNNKTLKVSGGDRYSYKLKDKDIINFKKSLKLI